MRTTLDWFVPTTNFSARSTVSTYIGVGILLAASCLTSRRSGSLLTGTIVGIATAALGAGVSILGAATLLALRHDATTLSAIDQSGGIAEVFILPVLLIVPGILFGSLGGLLGAASTRWRHT
jgi:hypothetical protein